MASLSPEEEDKQGGLDDDDDGTDQAAARRPCNNECAAVASDVEDHCWRHIVPEIHNVVATIQIECDPIDIQRLSVLMPYSTYDKAKFAAITIRLLQPTCTCLLFTSGKLVVTGASSWEEALLTAHHICDILRELHPGQQFRIVGYEVQNIVAHVELPLSEGQSMELDAFYRDHCEECTYQRSMFPGLIYRPLRACVVLLCFSSAKIVITGGKSVDQIFSEWERLRPVVMRYVR